MKICIALPGEGCASVSFGAFRIPIQPQPSCHVKSPAYPCRRTTRSCIIVERGSPGRCPCHGAMQATSFTLLCHVLNAKYAMGETLLIRPEVITGWFHTGRASRLSFKRFTITRTIRPGLLQPYRHDIASLGREFRFYIRCGNR